MSYRNWTVALLVCGVCFALANSSPAADEAKPGEIKLELKNFKFKPPAAVSDPDNLFTYSADEEKLSFFTNGPAEASLKIPADDDYEIVVSASGDSANNIRPKFKLSLDDKAIGEEVSLTADFMKDYKIPSAIQAGDHKLTIEFTNDTWKDGEYDSNLYIHGVKLVKKK